jgi:hypothetical protein
MIFMYGGQRISDLAWRNEPHSSQENLQDQCFCVKRLSDFRRLVCNIADLLPEEV